MSLKNYGSNDLSACNKNNEIDSNARSSHNSINLSTRITDYFRDNSEKSVQSRRSSSISIPPPNNTSLHRGSLPIQAHSFTCMGYQEIHNCKPYQEVIRNVVIYEASTKPPLSSSGESSIEDSAQKEPVKLYCGFTKRQMQVFFSLVLLSLNDIMGYSAISTFFPIVAESKGLNAVEYGLIFSSYSIFGIVSSLITGVVLVKVGAKFVVLSGMFWNAGAIICFGFLDQTAATPFLILSIISRGLMGFGGNAAFTAMFAIIFQEFNERAITVLSLSEALVGVGGMVGPLIGGALYDLGGFLTPFLVLGSAQALLLIICWQLLPYVPIEEKVASKSPFYLLTHSSAFIATAVVILVFTANSFIVSNMGAFLTEQFQLNATMIGVVFLCSSVFYAGMSPIWGYIADRWKNSYLIEVGLIGMGCGFVLAGPATFLREWFGWSSQHMWLVYVAAVVLGFFFGAAVMPTFNEMIKAVTELRMADSVLAQYGLVSGLWNTGFGIGDVMGPTLGGVLVQHFGFAEAGLVLAVICVSLSIIKLLHRYYRYRTRHRRLILVEDEERKPLLGGGNPA